MDIKWQLDFAIPPASVQIEHGDKITLLGSCFAAEMAEQFAENGFEVLSNPFGTLFHPVPIARLIRETISGIAEERIFQREDVFLSWDAAGEIYELNETGIRAELQSRRERLRTSLQHSNYLFITLGSSFGYRHVQTGEIVANCHKMPQSTFVKELTTAEILKTTWIETLELLKTFNPELQVVFTVSPVRHFKDGLVGNNRSKSHLFELIDALEATTTAFYFPAYEIIIDELRDYRFYNADGIHPNEMAVNYVWQRFEKTFFSAGTRQLCEEVRDFRKLYRHRVLHTKSHAAGILEQVKERKLHEFLTANPAVRW
jgi:hypothetical protein